MRTSNKILIIAFAILAFSLAGYDIQLRAIYRKGDYKKPFWNFVKLDYSGFNSIELNSSTAINILLVKGPYKVMVEPTATEFVKTRLEGKKLVITAEFGNHYRSINSDYTVFISCPDLNAFNADAFYSANGHLTIDTTALNLSWRPTVISGFTTDSLTLTESNASNVVIKNCRVNVFKAVVGISNNSGSDLTMGTGNSFKQTNFDVRNKGVLVLKNVVSDNVNYHLADSAQLMLNSATQQILKLN